MIKGDKMGRKYINFTEKIKILIYNNRFNFLIILEIFLLSIIFCWFILNVQSLASVHLEEHLFYPILEILIGIISGTALFALCILRKIKWKWFLISIIIILFGAVSLYIAWGTPCCIGG